MTMREQIGLSAATETGIIGDSEELFMDGTTFAMAPTQFAQLYVIRAPKCTVGLNRGASGHLLISLNICMIELLFIHHCKYN